jgi:hypothetical protein
MFILWRFQQPDSHNYSGSGKPDLTQEGTNRFGLSARWYAVTPSHSSPSGAARTKIILEGARHSSPCRP